MFGRSPAVTPFQCPYKFDTATYASHLKAKLQAIQNFVHTNLTKCAEQQKRQYDRHTLPRSFNPGDPVWYQQQKNYNRTRMENGLSVK